MGTIGTKHAVIGAALALVLGGTAFAWADDATPAPDAAPEDWSLHGQATFTEQYHPAFASPYRGANSLDPGSRGDETFDATLFAGLRLWEGGEAYINPEIDQGFGLSDTLGVAGFTSGEAYKIGKADPYFRLQRLFFRQSFDLGDHPDIIFKGKDFSHPYAIDRLRISEDDSNTCRYSTFLGGFFVIMRWVKMDNSHSSSL